MARADTRTALSLDMFAHYAGLHPLHFNQIESGSCGNPIMQWGWQMSGSSERPARVGREDIAHAISLAESALESWLGFPLLPRWIEDEQLDFPLSGYPWNHTGTLEWRKYITGGIEQKVVISAGVAVEYSDEDGDGYEETATIGPIATTVFNPEEIAVYYPGQAGSDAWEIRPIRVAIDTDAGEVTITARREQFVTAEAQSAISPEEIDLEDADFDTFFLAEVDVYRHYNDPQLQVQFLWGCGSCGGGGCQTCGYTTQYGCLRGLSPERSVVALAPGTWNPETLVFDVATGGGHGRPERARVWYLAGNRDFRQARSHHDMEPALAQAVTVLALAYLAGPLCLCMTGSWAHWSQDLALSESSDQDSTAFRVGRRVLDNPLGTTRGAQRAWELTSRYRVAESGNYVIR